MAKKLADLLAKMSPERRTRSRELAQKALTEMTCRGFAGPGSWLKFSSPRP